MTTTKKELETQKDPSRILILQDFSQLQLSNGFIQDLIFCIYKYSEQLESLDREYVHFLGRSHSENNTQFVVDCWKELLMEPIFECVKDLHVFSDGGRKHFKNSTNLQFMYALKAYFDIEVSYSFFESYHGFSICDTIASQAKRQLIISQKK